MSKAEGLSLGMLIVLGRLHTMPISKSTYSNCAVLRVLQNVQISLKCTSITQELSTQLIKMCSGSFVIRINPVIDCN